MSTRATYVPGPAEGPSAPASSYDLGQKIKAAIAAGVFVTIGGWVIGLLLGLFWWTGFLEIFGAGAPVVGLLVMCWLGFQWVKAAAARPWQVDDLIRERQWTLEDKERKKQHDAAEAARDDVTSGKLDHDNDPETLNEAQHLHLVALEILTRHYMDGLAVTREVMEAEGMSQPDWNAVNKLLKAVGLKRGYKLRQDLDLMAAWQIWWGQVRFDGNGAWVKTAKGKEKWVDLGSTGQQE